MPIESDPVRIALILQKQQDDEAKLKELEQRVDAIDRKVFAAQVGMLVLIAIGTFVGWLINAGDKVRAWFH